MPFQKDGDRASSVVEHERSLQFELKLASIDSVEKSSIRHYVHIA